MGMPEAKVVEFDLLTGDVTTTPGPVVDISQLSEKGMEYIKGAGAAHAADLEGSVSGRIWNVITALDATKTAAIADHINFVRTNDAVGGALGTDTLCMVAGKVL